MNAVAAQISAEQAPPDQLQYLTFHVASEVFAIGILAVKEILEYQELTPVPMMPECIRGVINLRGAVVPVVDLARRFGKPAGPVTKRTCIVIVERQGLERREDLGVIVDAVNAVAEIAPADIEPPPALGARIRTDFIRGLGKVANRFVMILDVDRALRIEADDAQNAAADSVS